MIRFTLCGVPTDKSKRFDTYRLAVMERNGSCPICIRLSSVESRRRLCSVVELVRAVPPRVNGSDDIYPVSHP